MKQLTKALFALTLSLYGVSLCAKTLVYAHRGGTALWPENTLYAYQKSLDLKVDFVDMDIQLSKDGVWMVTHDACLNRSITRNKHGQWLTKKRCINRLSRNAIQQYDVGEIKPSTQYSNRYPEQQKGLHQKIPTLIEVFHFVKRNQTQPTGFQIEVKVSKQDLYNPALPKRYANKLNQVLIDEKLVALVEIQSFDFRVLDALHHLNSKLKLAYLTAADHPFPKWSGGQNLKPGEHVSQLISNLNGTLWEPQALGLRKKDVSLAHALGLKVVVWGLPHKKLAEKKEIKRLVSLGVDGFITDRPDLTPWIRSIPANVNNTDF